MSGRTMQKMDSRHHNSKPYVHKTSHEQKEEFERIVQYYLESNPMVSTNGKISELEVRFNTNPKLSKPVSKIDYDNVVKQLYANGFIPDIDEGTHMLRIQNQYINQDGIQKTSNLRAEITGIDLIQEYCRTNSIQKLIDMPSTTFEKLKFTQKQTALKSSGEYINKVHVPDFNLKVSYQTEQDFMVNAPFCRKTLDKWNDSLKTFRSMNRVRFSHPDLPIFADLTVIKTSDFTLDKDKNQILIPKYTIQDSNLFNNVEQYEVELEIDNYRVGFGTEYNNIQKLMIALRKCIRVVLCGIQNTKFPISYKIRDNICQSYMRLLLPEDDVNKKNMEIKRWVKPSNFIGPGSVTLQMEHVTDNAENANKLIPNIRNRYTVTDKADGDRSLLYINEEGNIYLIDTNMNVTFTGTKTTEKTTFNSILDGELIKYDKHGKLINLYAAFDIYYVHDKSVRDLPFLSPVEKSGVQLDPPSVSGSATLNDHRLSLLYKFVNVLNPISILETGTKEVHSKKIPCGFHIQCKSFYYDSAKNTIFDGCSTILSNKNDGIFEYNTDGLIFTPADLAVSANSVGEKSKIQKTWGSSFKWKPAEHNTIDFLVTVQKNKAKRDEIHHIFQDGKQMESVQTVSQYKTLVLMTGFTEKKHSIMNAYQSILDDMISDVGDGISEDEYKPVPFHPTEPRDPFAHLSNIMLVEKNGKHIMQTEEGDIFTENMIVEFKYVITNKSTWKWVPIKVRYDKTAELLGGVTKNYGNPYHVANSNWQSIHNPITEEMISTGQHIPELAGDTDDVYYSQNSEETTTQPLRDFHNRYIKSKLISSVSNRDDTLIDYACGVGGDLAKWKYAKLKFVFGIDYAYDNIHNAKNGICARYIKEKKKNKQYPDALFIKSDSGKNIRTHEDTNTSQKDKQIISAVFGTGPKDATLLGKGVYKNYGIADSGFNISSCQFAMHYFFEDSKTVHSFLRNLSECTKVNGYYIGTCYDGETVFNLLRSKEKEESITIFKGGQKIYEITKQYDKTGFPDDDMSLGYGIDIYQESINTQKIFREYLVNFKYLIRVMEDYGFVLITPDEANHMNLPNSTGLFDELFTQMEQEICMRPSIKPNYRYAPNISTEEKQISFMNRYFVFKKVRSVDAKQLGEIVEKQSDIVEKEGIENIQQKLPIEVKPIAKKTKKKIVLKQFSVEQDDGGTPDSIISSKPKLKIVGKVD